MADKDFDFATWLETGDAKLATKTNRNSYSNSLWVNAIVSTIAETVAGIPKDFIKPDGSILDVHAENETDDVAKLFCPPYGKVIPTFEDLINGVIVNKLLDGEGLMVADDFINGKPTTIKIGSPDRLNPIIKNDNIQGWSTVVNKKRVNFLNGEVVQDKIYNPFDPIRGLSPLKAARFAIEVNYYADAWNAAFFKSGDVPSVIVESDQILQQEQREQLYKNFNKYKRDLDRARGIFILEKFKLAKRTINVKDFEFIDAKKLSREELCAIFKMPPAEVGIFEYANYANSTEQQVMYYEKTIIPLVKKICKIIQIHILDVWFPEYKIVPDLSEIIALIERLQNKIDSAKKLHEMGVPFFLINKSMKLNIERFDGDEIGYINGLPISQVINSEKPPVPAQPQPEEEPGKIKKIKQKFPAHKMYMLKPGGKQINTNTEFFRSYIARVHRNIFTPFTVKISRYYKAFFRSMGRDVAEQMRNVGAAGSFYFDHEKWAGMYNDVLNPVVRQLAAVTMYYLKREIKAKNNTRTYEKLMGKKVVAEDIILEDFMTEEQITGMMEALKKVISKATLAVTQTFANGIVEIVEEGLRSGITVQEMSNQILDLSENRVANATTNAQTLTTSSYNTARDFGYKINNIDKQAWISMRDAGVREEHAMQDSSGEVVKVGNNFTYTGIAFPGDPNGSAKQIINCRCLTIPIVPEVFGGDLEEYDIEI